MCVPSPLITPKLREVGTNMLKLRYNKTKIPANKIILLILYLISTEVLTLYSPVWTLATHLPRAGVGLGGMTLNRRLFISIWFGGIDYHVLQDDDYNLRFEIIWSRLEIHSKMKVGKLCLNFYPLSSA